MRTTVELPRVGETAQVVVVIEWLVEPGTTVAEGQPILRVETDKVDADVPAPVAGTLVEHLVAPEDEIEIGAPICVIAS